MKPVAWQSSTMIKASSADLPEIEGGSILDALSELPTRSGAVSSREDTPTIRTLSPDVEEQTYRRTFEPGCRCDECTAAPAERQASRRRNRARS